MFISAYLLQENMKNNIKSKAILVMIFSVLTRTISFLFKIYLSREFGAELLGLFSMATAVFGLLTMISSSGIPLTVSRQIAETNAISNSNKKAYGIISSGLIVSLIINTITITLFIIFRHQILSLLADERAEKLCLIVLPATFSTCVYNVIRSYFMGRKSYLIYSVTELIEEILNVVIVMLLVSGVIISVDKSEILPITFTTADILCFILIILIFFFKGNKLCKPYQTKELLKSSTPITFMRLFGSLATTFTAIMLPNRLVVSGLTIESATEEFGRATGMAYPLLFAPLAITSALSTVLLPEIAELNASNNLKSISHKLDKSMSISYAISVIFFIVYYSLGEELCGFLFNDSRAGIFLSFASGMVLLISLVQLTTTSLNSVGKERTCFINNIIGIALLLVCLYILPQYIGILSLAVGQTLLYLVVFILNSIALCKLKISELNYYKPLFIISICALVIASLVKYIKVLLFDVTPFWLLIILGICISILYCISLLIIPSYRAYVLEIITAIKKRFNPLKNRQKKLK